MKSTALKVMSWLSGKTRQKQTYMPTVLIIDPENIQGKQVMTVLNNDFIVHLETESDLDKLGKSWRLMQVDLIIASEVFFFKIRNFRLLTGLGDKPVLVIGSDKWPEKDLQLISQLIISGAHEFLTPPFTRALLLPKINNYLNMTVP